MAKTMKLTIITPNGTILDREGVTYLEVKGTEGMLGIMPGHSPFVTTLAPSPIMFKTEMHKYDMAMSEGIIYVDFSKVTILADAAFFKNQIDFKFVKELLANAKERLAVAKEKEEAKKIEDEINIQEIKLSLENLAGRERLKK